MFNKLWSKGQNIFKKLFGPKLYIWLYFENKTSFVCGNPDKILVVELRHPGIFILLINSPSTTLLNTCVTVYLGSQEHRRFQGGGVAVYYPPE